MKIEKIEKVTKTLSCEEVERVICEYFDLDVDDDAISFEWGIAAATTTKRAHLKALRLIEEINTSESEVSVRSQSDFEGGS